MDGQCLPTLVSFSCASASVTAHILNRTSLSFSIQYRRQYVRCCFGFHFSWHETHFTWISLWDFFPAGVGRLRQQVLPVGTKPLVVMADDERRFSSLIR